MSDNKRIFYACQAVAICPEGAGENHDRLEAANIAHGVQSVGITTNFNLEQAFELAQIEIYENIEGVPDVEVTLEKLLDGYPLLYHLATTGIYGLGQTGIAARADKKCDLHLGIFDASANNVATALIDGSPPALPSTTNSRAEVEVYCSGMYVSSISYTVPVDGNATESMTLVGNNKEWLRADEGRFDSGTGANDSVAIGQAEVAGFDGTDTPRAIAGASGGIQRREDVILAGSILPLSIKGVGDGLNIPIASGYGNALIDYNKPAKGPMVHIQNFTCSTDFGREDILELGRKTPYFRPANFPVEVTCEFEAITTSGDFVGAYELGDPDLMKDPDTGVLLKSSGDNLQDECIFVLLRAGYGFDLGNKNKLSSISYGGGDAGGGNAAVTYSYSNFNQLDVQDYRHENRIGFGITTLGAGLQGVSKFAADKGAGAFAVGASRLVEGTHLATENWYKPIP
jgi:hypothetical protein|tara:strand:+ start:2851 stop:4221 length:1371 start_codon:yes stop_codon:yes gene_type:complete